MSQRVSRGTRVDGRYEVVQQLPDGARCSLWLALDRRLEREVVLKSSVASVASGPPILADRTALAEACMTARLNHPSIVQVFDVVTDFGRDWIVLEALGGTDLSAATDGRNTRRPPLSLVWCSLRRAVEALEGAGLRHGAIRGEHVRLCPDGRVVITGLGAASDAAPSAVGRRASGGTCETAVNRSSIVPRDDLSDLIMTMRAAARASGRSGTWSATRRSDAAIRHQLEVYEDLYRATAIDVAIEVDVVAALDAAAGLTSVDRPMHAVQSQLDGEWDANRLEMPRRRVG